MQRVGSDFFFSSRRRHTRCGRDWSSDVCSSDLRAELFQSDVWKTLNKVLAYGLNLNAVDTRELSRAVHRIERMVGRLLPSVELKVGIVKNVLSKLRINQTPCQLVGKRRGRIRNNRFCG